MLSKCQISPKNCLGRQQVDFNACSNFQTVDVRIFLCVRYISTDVAYISTGDRVKVRLTPIPIKSTVPPIKIWKLWGADWILLCWQKVLISKNLSSFQPRVNILHKEGKLFPNVDFWKHKHFSEIDTEIKFPQYLYSTWFQKLCCNHFDIEKKYNTYSCLTCTGDNILISSNYTFGVSVSN